MSGAGGHRARCVGESSGDLDDVLLDESDRHAQGRLIGSHLEGFTRCGADAACCEREQRRSLVADVHPEVDAIGAGEPDSCVGEHVGHCAATAGVLGTRRGDGVERRRVVEHLEQHGLQDAAAPAGAEQAPVEVPRGDTAIKSKVPTKKP